MNDNIYGIEVNEVIIIFRYDSLLARLHKVESLLAQQTIDIGSFIIESYITNQRKTKADPISSLQQFDCEDLLNQQMIHPGILCLYNVLIIWE